SHPAVYIMIVPGFAIISELVTVHSRKHIFGYKAIALSSVAIAVIGFLVWGHHMFTSGQSLLASAVFSFLTFFVAVPTAIKVLSWVATLYKGSIRINTPMVYTLVFLFLFTIGGLTGLFLGTLRTDIHLHDTYYVIGHFHYVIAPGVIFGLFGGIYYWFPKATGRKMSEILGHLHFWPTLICMNVIFMPMFIQGLAGVSRRLYDGGSAYAHAQPVLHWNAVISMAAWTMAIAQIPFILNFFGSIFFGKKVESNPWEATTLEWTAAPSPPPHGNFPEIPTVYCGPYEYSQPDSETDFHPQNQPVEA
ncbi:MAG: cbb3-type cytochrome c oxidase subunit I, partial [Candidatus Omnitrophica bacterium]|nr:cbb3-type cytochrome c oxidase subunit I [Candidatus Omnitrophota bacterium]